MASPESRWDLGLFDTALWDASPQTGAVGMRRLERTAAASMERQEIKRMERTAPGIMRRIDE